MESLKIDHWSKAIASFFAALALAALAKGMMLLLLLAVGGFLYGVGEWINHPHQEVLLPPDVSGYPSWLKGAGYMRNNSFTGVSFSVVGAFLFIASALKTLYIAE